MRGRVMGLYMLLFLGGTPLGAPLLGLLGRSWAAGARHRGGAASVLAVIVVMLVLRWTLTEGPRRR